MVPIVKDNLPVADELGAMTFIHSPFCGTCHLARQILVKIEEEAGKNLFNEMNAALFPAFMQNKKIESVPCLFTISMNGEEQRIYSFEKMAQLSSVLTHNG
ncbi:thioredoxin family protein [Paraliobacillus ryukyuensis]|uniref:thioredoxin family protein n=1 Tax=Paraliobacillus ryukyuensis TaxID=200904 RepID=UPI0009A5AEEC|nr:thioredoxin family protein [Paraliobacillus ryukyuensis]